VSGLAYVGKDASAGRDVENRTGVDAVYNTGISHDYVAARAHTLASAYAAKVYVDTQDSLYQDAGYSDAQNALLVPVGARGTASGVAALDASAKVPSAQVPIMGTGLLRGPYGPLNTVTTTVSALNTPIKLFDFFTGSTGTDGLILPFVAIMCQSVGGRPVIEVRGGDNTQTNYADQTLLAQGYGRSFYNDWQTVTAKPVAPDVNAGQDGLQHSWSTATNSLIQCWMYDALLGTTSTTQGYVITAALYFARTSL
jgi:hypothetical protein